MLELQRKLHKFNDKFSHYNVDKYLGNNGFVVEPSYENSGIDVELLRCRQTICKTFGIKLTIDKFFTPHSNNIADLVGFKVDNRLR